MSQCLGATFTGSDPGEHLDGGDPDTFWASPRGCQLHDDVDKVSGVAIGSDEFDADVRE
jgi:hypothetical protein